MRKLRFLLCALVMAGLPASPAVASPAFLIEVFESNAPSISTLAEADLLIATGTPTFTAVSLVIEHDDLGDSTRGHFALNQPFPGGADTTFAVRVTGQFAISSTGFWTLGINHDDGARLSIDGVPLAAFPFLTDNIDTMGSTFLTAGNHSVEIVFFENGGGASLEFFGASGIHTAFNSNFFLIESVPEPGVLALLALGLLGLGFHSRRKAG